MIFKNKKAIIWDLDNTLYPITKEFGNLLDEIMAKVAVEEFGVKLSFEEAVKTVRESYSKYRDGGQIFYDEYGIDKVDFYHAYSNNRKIKEAVDKIVPVRGLPKKIKKIKLEQFVFSHSSRKTCEAIFKKIGLWEIFKERFYSVEDFGIFTKNSEPDIYLKLCKKIKQKPADCIFVDDSYSNLEPSKETGMTTVRIYYNDNSTGDKEYIDAAYKGVISFIDDFLKRTAS